MENDIINSLASDSNLNDLPACNRKTEEEIQSEIKASYRAQRAEAASKRIPRDFLAPLDNTKPRIDVQAMRNVLEWDGRRSMLAKGASQCGKTRAIYKLLFNQFVDEGRTFLALDERQVFARVTDAFGEKGVQALDEKLCGVDILFLDDLDKVNFSNGVMAQNALTLIFGVIKDRMANLKPTFITLNTSVTEVFQSAGAAVTQSLIERMKQDDHWQIEAFKAK